MRKIFKSRISCTIFGVVIGVFITCGIVYAATINSSDVSYTPSDSNWNVSNVSDAIDELYTMRGNTPNDVRNWLKIGNVNKDYTSITQVLSDTDALQALMNNDRACSYLKSSTEWINLVTSSENAMTYIGANDACADILYSDNDWANNFAGSQYWNKVLKPLVPTMTSNTIPGGEVIYNTDFSVYYAWQAFGNLNTNSGTTWAAPGNGTNVGYIGYKFLTNVKVNKIFMENRNEDTPRAINKFKFQYSDDGTTWRDVTSQQFINPSSSKNARSYYSVESDVSAKYYRIFITSVYDTSYYGVGKLQFYGR